MKTIISARMTALLTAAPLLADCAHKAAVPAVAAQAPVKVIYDTDMKHRSRGSIR